jgi:hypothetical protein
VHITSLNAFPVGGIDLPSGVRGPFATRRKWEISRLHKLITTDLEKGELMEWTSPEFEEVSLKTLMRPRNSESQKVLLGSLVASVCASRKTEEVA